MSERNTERSSADKDEKEKKSPEEQAHDQAIARALAQLSMSQNESTRALLRRAEAEKQAIQLEARREGMILEHQRRIAAEQARARIYPYGIEALGDENKDFSSIYARLQSARQTEQEGKVALETEQAEKLSARHSVERGKTLEAARETARLLSGAGVEPDTHAFLRRTETKRIWNSPKPHDKFIKKVETPVYDSKPNVKGWLMPIKGQLNKHLTVMLTTEGEIFTGFGDFIDGKPATDDKAAIPNRFEYKPSSEGVDSEHGDMKPGRPEHRYTSILTEDINSDIGLANLPTSGAVGRGKIIAARESAMQDAVVQLLIDHEVSVPEPAAEA